MTPDDTAGAIVVETTVRAPARVIWELFTDPTQLVRWIGIAATLEPRPDGAFRFELFAGEFCSGRYLELVPYARLVFTWGWESEALPVAPGSTTVTVDLVEHEGVTTVRLTHTGLDAAMGARHLDGWQQYLRRLTAAAEGLLPGPDPAQAYRDGRPPAHDAPPSTASPRAEGDGPHHLRVIWGRVAGRACAYIARRGKMPIDVLAQRTIHRDRRSVASFAMDPANDVAWIGGIKSVRILSPAPVAQGTQVARTAAFLGKRFAYVNEIVAYDPPRRLVMRSVKSPFPMRVTYEFAEAGKATAAGIRVEGEAAGFYRLAAPVLSWFVRRSVSRDLKALATLLESAVAPAPKAAQTD